MTAAPSPRPWPQESAREWKRRSKKQSCGLPTNKRRWSAMGRRLRAHIRAEAVCQLQQHTLGLPQRRLGGSGPQGKEVRRCCSCPGEVLPLSSTWSLLRVCFAFSFSLQRGKRVEGYQAQRQGQNVSPPLFPLTPRWSSARPTGRPFPERLPSLFSWYPCSRGFAVDKLNFSSLALQQEDDL